MSVNPTNDSKTNANPSNVRDDDAESAFARAAPPSVPSDVAEVVLLLRRFADEGHADSQCMLATMYESGGPVPKDLRQALELYQKAAEQGLPGAQVALGRLYEEGNGVPRDYEKAVALFAKAAGQENALGQFWLGEVYRRGTGVPLDPKLAFSWFSKAAEQGLAEAQYAVGTAYALGIVVKFNDEQAYNWFEKAALQGQAEARMAIGEVWVDDNGDLEITPWSIERLGDYAAPDEEEDAKMELRLMFATAKTLYDRFLLSIGSQQAFRGVIVALPWTTKRQRRKAVNSGRLLPDARGASPRG